MANEKFIKDLLNPGKRHVVVDIETTGLFPRRGDRVIEIGAVAIENGKCVAEFESLVNCGKGIPRRVQELHGISSEMLKGQAPPEEVFPNFLRFASRSTLVAHNANFDIEFLRYELGRLGLFLRKRYICTLQLSRRLFPQLPNYRLDAVYRYLLDEADHNARRHRALDDARLTAEIWLRMMKYG